MDKENKEVRILDYRLTEIGRQNWEVCHRMVMHDLLDASIKNKEISEILKFYGIQYLSNGGYTMRLPRLGTFPKKVVKPIKKK